MGCGKDGVDHLLGGRFADRARNGDDIRVCAQHVPASQRAECGECVGDEDHGAVGRHGAHRFFRDALCNDTGRTAGNSASYEVVTVRVFTAQRKKDVLRLGNAGVCDETAVRGCALADDRASDDRGKVGCGMG